MDKENKKDLKKQYLNIAVGYIFILLILSVFSKYGDFLFIIIKNAPPIIIGILAIITFCLFLYIITKITDNIVIEKMSVEFFILLGLAAFVYTIDENIFSANAELLSIPYLFILTIIISRIISRIIELCSRPKEGKEKANIGQSIGCCITLTIIFYIIFFPFFKIILIKFENIQYFLETLISFVLIYSVTSEIVKYQKSKEQTKTSGSK